MGANDSAEDALASAALPPFPEDVPTHPLLVVDYAKLQAGDGAEQDTLWKACTEVGFFYLKNHGVDTRGMWEMGEATMALPLEEKMKFDQGDAGRSLGYKAAGAHNTDEYGNRDTVEFINVSKDDALARPQVVHRTYPATVEARMPAVRAFIEAADAVTRTLMDVMSDRLGLPRAVLRARHDAAQRSLSESRIIRNPPAALSAATLAPGAHTDFGSLSFLHNILGGLQVLAPGTQTWQYVKPLPGHAICNIGDALTIYSAGVLRSNMHRVMSPPGEQAKHTRWSLVYFFRPASASVLEPLTQSPLIAAAAREHAAGIGEGITAEQWLTRRVKNLRAGNRTGPETWRASRGTEHAGPAASAA